MFGLGFDRAISARVSPSPRYRTVPVEQLYSRFAKRVPLEPTRLVTMVRWGSLPPTSSTVHLAFASVGTAKGVSAACSAAEVISIAAKRRKRFIDQSHQTHPERDVPAQHRPCCRPACVVDLPARAIGKGGSAAGSGLTRAVAGPQLVALHAPIFQLKWLPQPLRLPSCARFARG